MTTGGKHKANRRNRVKLKKDALWMMETIKANYLLAPHHYDAMKEIMDRLAK